MNSNQDQEKIGNNYGVAYTAEEFVKFYKTHLNPSMNKTARIFTQNNLTMRQELCSFGFSRVSRNFADAVIVIFNQNESESEGMRRSRRDPRGVYTSDGTRIGQTGPRCEDAPCCGCCD